VQAIVYRDSRATGPAYAVAVKQLYASHYFETALDLTVCVPDHENPGRGFYLITLKGSQQAGLTGLKGGIVRKVAVDKTRSSLERALGAISKSWKAGRIDPAACGDSWFYYRRTASVLLTILLFAIVLAVVYVARRFIAIFAFSILFAYLINPIVRFLQRHSLFFKNLRGPHVLEAYLALIVFTCFSRTVFFRNFAKMPVSFSRQFPP